MTARVDRLGAGDLATLWAEEPATPMHIGLAGLVDPGPLVGEDGRLRLEELRAAVDARLARVPQLRRRIRWTGFGQGRPAVVDDQEFAIARHVTTVDLGGGLDEAGFWTWCANQALEPFDRAHPLWRVTLATGLAGRRVGVLVAMHHALADGIAGAALAAKLLDPASGTVAPARPWRPAPPAGPLALTVDAVVSWLAAVTAALTRLPRAPAATRAAVRDLAGTGAALARHAPATSLGRPIGRGRRLVVLRRPLDQVRQAGHVHGATVNDVLLAAVAGGLRRLLVSRGESVDGLELRVSVPVGAPGGSRNAGGSTPMVLPLPVGDADPAGRLVRIVAITRAAKAGRDRGYRGLLASPLVPISLLRLGIRWLRRRGGSRVDLYVTNVPGPPQPLWLLGARLATAVPIAPLVAGSRWPSPPSPTPATRLSPSRRTAPWPTLRCWRPGLSRSWTGRPPPDAVEHAARDEVVGRDDGRNDGGTQPRRPCRGQVGGGVQHQQVGRVDVLHHEPGGPGRSVGDAIATRS